MANMKSPLHDIPTERHREGQLDRAARVAGLSNCHLLAIDGSDTLDGCRAGIAGDGLLILGIRDRPRALGVMISRAARTARAYLRASLLTVGRKTRGLNFCRYARPKDRVCLSLQRPYWIFGAVLCRTRSTRDRYCSSRAGSACGPLRTGAQAACPAVTHTPPTFGFLGFQEVRPRYGTSSIGTSSFKPSRVSDKLSPSIGISVVDRWVTLSFWSQTPFALVP